MEYIDDSNGHYYTLETTKIPPIISKMSITQFYPVILIIIAFWLKLGKNIVRIEFSPMEHINDNNGHYGPLETTDKNQLEVTTWY